MNLHVTALLKFPALQKGLWLIKRITGRNLGEAPLASPECADRTGEFL